MRYRYPGLMNLPHPTAKFGARGTLRKYEFAHRRNDAPIHEFLQACRDVDTSLVHRPTIDAAQVHPAASAVLARAKRRVHRALVLERYANRSGATVHLTAAPNRRARSERVP